MTAVPPLTPAEAAAIEKAAALAAGEGLTPVELAAATAMADRQNRAELAAGYGAAAAPGDFADEARAVVSAVRSQIAAEALREAAKYLYDHRRDNDGAFDLWRMYEAGGPEWLSSRANALSLPASKETP